MSGKAPIGEVLKTKGEASSTNRALLKAQLRKQGINPSKVQKKISGLDGKQRQKITPFDIAVFTRQMATMMKAGVPLVQSLISWLTVEHPTLRELVVTIKYDVAVGNSFAGRWQTPRYFDDLFCNLIESGEKSGALETMLERGHLHGKTEKLKKKVKKAMTYPIAVLSVAFIVTGILLVKVVPQFQEVFKSFGADLPAFTLMVIAMSEWMQAYWYI